MTAVILTLTMLFFGYLVLENSLAKRNRRALRHVVYVNGTRGKSSTARLIDAGLRAGGVRTFCKTTGTLPMTIDCQGNEQLIPRRGKANIKEQLFILSRAAKEGADVLVTECMAVDPLYQHISQHRMMQADVGVITNVRLDHTDVMGETLEEIADALANTIPLSGVLFTAEQDLYPRLSRHAQCAGTVSRCVLPDGSILDMAGKPLSLPLSFFEEFETIDFAENVSLALAVCSHLGVDCHTALEGMRHYRRDPYALSLHRIGAGALFIGGLSINDPLSSALVYQGLVQKHALQNKRLILLLNNRGDRMSRTTQMVELAQSLNPDEIWLLGAGQRILTRRIRQLMPHAPVIGFAHPRVLDFSALTEQDVLFAAGNIALQGKELMERVRREGTAL